jgi:hypothetical protein
MGKAENYLVDRTKLRPSLTRTDTGTNQGSSYRQLIPFLCFARPL